MKVCFFNTVKSWGGGEKWHYEIQVFKEGYTYSKVGGDSHDEAVEEAIWYCVNNLI